jgi:hypothetical protein
MYRWDVGYEPRWLHLHVSKEEQDATDTRHALPEAVQPPYRTGQDEAYHIDHLKTMKRRTKTIYTMWQLSSR